MVELDKIYCEDCLETLKKIEDNSIDLIITSPPYNKGWYSQKSLEGKIQKKKIDYGVFDDTMLPEDYEKWQRQIIEESLRVLKPTGSLFYNHIDILRDLNTIHPTYVYDYPIKQIIVWDRGNTPKLDVSYFFPITEWIFWLKKDKDSRPYFDRKQADFQKSIWRLNADTKNTHPAPFPIELPANIIKCCSKEGDIVYDPFMGSGTTAKAARDLGRHFIGSELNPEYIRISEERLGLL